MLLGELCNQVGPTAYVTQFVLWFQVRHPIKCDKPYIFGLRTRDRYPAAFSKEL
jgi:hypothetical protein